MSPPSEYLSKALTYPFRQCLTAPPPSGCSWTKSGKFFDTGHTNSYVLNSGITETNLTKISHKVENWWPTNTLKSEFQYSNSISNASMTRCWVSAKLHRSFTVLLYVNSLINIFDNDHVTCHLFADDAKLYIYHHIIYSPNAIKTNTIKSHS